MTVMMMGDDEGEDDVENDDDKDLSDYDDDDNNNDSHLSPTRRLLICTVHAVPDMVDAVLHHSQSSGSH